MWQFSLRLCVMSSIRMCDVLMPRLLHHDSITLELRAEQTHPSLSCSPQVATMKKVSNTEEKNISVYSIGTKGGMFRHWECARTSQTEWRWHAYQKTWVPESEVKSLGTCASQEGSPSLGGCGGGRGQGARISLQRASNALQASLDRPHQNIRG